MLLKTTTATLLFQKKKATAFTQSLCFSFFFQATIDVLFLVISFRVETGSVLQTVCVFAWVWWRSVP